MEILKLKITILEINSSLVLVAKTCPTLCELLDCSQAGSSLHGISQARILEWVTISFSGGSSWPRDWTWISTYSSIGRQIFYHWTIREASGTMLVSCFLRAWKNGVLVSLLSTSPWELLGLVYRRNIFCVCGCVGQEKMAKKWPSQHAY